MKELSASDITKEALIILRARGCICWRNNNVRAVKGRTFTGMPGVSDIIGLTHEGLFIAVEVKKIGDRLSEGQKNFLFMVESWGGVALIAYQEGDSVAVEDYKTFLNKIKKAA